MVKPCVYIYIYICVFLCGVLRYTVTVLRLVCVCVDRGILDQVVAAGRHLLSAGGGRLAAFNVVAVTGTGPYRPGVDGTYASTSGAAAALTAAADTAGAYLVPADGGGGGGGGGPAGSGGVWSPVHRQWCTLLQFSSALLRTLGQYVDVEREVRAGVCVCVWVRVCKKEGKGGERRERTGMAGGWEGGRARLGVEQVSRWCGSGVWMLQVDKPWRCNSLLC